MAKSKSPDGPEYENCVEDIAEKLNAWDRESEPADAFARRLVGLMRMEQKKWEQKR